MAEAHHDVLLVGLGAVAESHLRALERIPDAEVIAGVDTAPKPGVRFRGHPVPVYRSLREASHHHHPGVVVIATPTPAHATACTEAADYFPTATILVEKPAASTLPDAEHILTGIGSRQPVEVAYHMYFSPEVTWAARTAQAHDAELGVPVAIQAVFTDPYQDDPAATASLGSSWIDSGINALSILTRFTHPAHRTSLRRHGETTRPVFEAHITCQTAGRQIDALILTTWHVTDATKTTRIRYSSGADLIMDHTAVAGYLIQDHQLTDVYGSDRTISRRDRHYLALYESWLINGNPILPTETSLHLHHLLL
jgi:predicted dehydrogenase